MQEREGQYACLPISKERVTNLRPRHGGMNHYMYWGCIGGRTRNMMVFFGVTKSNKISAPDPGR